jgi:sterol desaturase/sphingolipid hydroxylase (fatty acid hydroxylase superfamily)
MLPVVGVWIGSISTAVLVGSLLILTAAETLRPRREQFISLGLRWTTNVGLQVLNSVLFAVLAPAFAATALLGLVAPHWHPAASVLPYLGEPGVLVLGVALLDLANYWVHRLSHRVFTLWRVHAVHHADPELDTSTGFRHHPAEALISFATSSAVFMLLGLPGWVYPLFATVVVVTSLAQHSNLALPGPLDRALRLLFVTPAMHHVHHSVDRRDFDCNYGEVLSIWDRLFGTYRAAPARGVDRVRFGVEPFTAAEFASPLWGLLLPFKIKRQAAPPSTPTWKPGQTVGTVTPIMSPARISAARRVSFQRSVPAGRRGSTIQR